MFASSVIRRLARSEEMFAETENFVGLGAHMTGPMDLDALSDAFDALLEAHPVLGGQIEPCPDGGHQIVSDDLLHPGITVDAEPIRFDQREALVHLRVSTSGDQTQPTLYVHHSLADGHHQFSLIEELFSNYTDLVTTGAKRPVTVTPAPDPLEAVLEARGVAKGKRSGLERFMPAAFAYDLPASRRAAGGPRSGPPTKVPMAS